MSRQTLMWFGAVFVASVALASATNDTAVLQGDVVVYVERLEAMLDGELPYRDTPFEHLPLSLVPLLVAELLSRVPGVSFGAGLTIFNGAALLGVLTIAHRLGAASGAASRWLLLAAPLFPIVLFRLDPLSLLFAGLALVALQQRRPAATTTGALLGVATRGWPVVLAVPMWRRGWRAPAVGIVLATAALAGWLLMTPGFTGGRSFPGVHVETLVGSAMLLIGHLTGNPATITPAAGALYVGDTALPAIVNGLVGVGITLLVLARSRSSRQAAGTLALLTYGLLLVSPLLSAQMLLWPTLFVALVAVAPVVLVFATGALTAALLMWWEPASWWWATLAVVRNLALLATPVLIATRGMASRHQPSISRRNLPV